MAFDITGRLYKKFDTAQVTDSFKKREFVLEVQEGNYNQLIKFQLTQNNCDKMDPFNEGEDVKVTFSLKGREYTKEGKTTYFTNLDAWRLEKAGAAQPVASAPPAATDFPSASDDPGAGFDDDLPF